MRGQFNRINDVRQPNFTLRLKMTLPPHYLLVHRVWLGALGVLSQLNSTVPVRAELTRWIPEFTPS
jgi:hypothetical protein